MHALELLLPRIKSASDDQLDLDATFALVQALVDKYDHAKHQDAPPEWVIAQLVMLIERTAPGLERGKQLEIAIMALEYAKARVVGRY